MSILVKSGTYGCERAGSLQVVVENGDSLEKILEAAKEVQNRCNTWAGQCPEDCPIRDLIQRIPETNG